MCLIVLVASLRRSRLGVAGRWASRCSSTCATGSSSRAASRTCRRLARRVRARLGRRYGVRRRLRRRHPASPDPARAGRGRRLRQGRGGRHPRAAALRRLRRPARRAAAAAVPPGRQRLPAPPGLGRGLRHRHPPLPRPRRRRPSRSAPRATRRRRCARPARAAGRVLAQRGPDPRADQGRDVHRAPRAGCAATTRCCSTPTAWSSEPRRDIDLGIDRMLGEAEQLLRGSFDGAARRLVDTLGSRDDDRAMVRRFAAR